MYEKIELDELIDDFIEQNTDGILEGTRGVKNLESLLSQLAYAGVGDFLADNPEAIEEVLSWIGNQDQITEWRDAIIDSITPTYGDIELIEDFIEQNTDGILEGTRGVKNLESLLKQISGYTGVGDFLADNPGAIDAVLTWIGDQDQMTEWRDALLDSIAPDDDHDDDGDPIAVAASKLD